MQEDYTYTNAATADNMDTVYEGSVNAVAEYDIIDYIVNAGQYLPADSETVITCPAGSFCPGISGNVQYNQSAPQGIQTCPTGYDSSAAGASSDTQCYRQCSGNVTIEHATGVTGNDYYGNGADTCEPTGCDNGWHLNSGFNGNITNITNNRSGVSAYINGNGEYREWDSNNGQAFYGMTEDNSWTVYYTSNNNMVFGSGLCSTRAGAEGTYTGQYSSRMYHVISNNFVSNLVDETGNDEEARYCYCNITGYKGSGSNLQSISTPWLFLDEFDGVPQNGGWCSESCAANCAYKIKAVGDTDNAFRLALLGSATPGLASCTANTITINWSDASAADISANNAGTATYGSDVRTPVKATTIKGKTFRGWRFSKPETTNLPE